MPTGQANDEHSVVNQDIMFDDDVTESTEYAGFDSMTTTPGEVKAHLGRNLFAVAKRSFKTVDIRQYFFLNEAHNKIHPTRKGVNLSATEYGRLVGHLPDLESRWAGLRELVPCRNTHRTPAEHAECTHCTPRPKSVQNVVPEVQRKQANVAVNHPTMSQSLLPNSPPVLAATTMKRVAPQSQNIPKKRQRAQQVASVIQEAQEIPTAIEIDSNEDEDSDEDEDTTDAEPVFRNSEKHDFGVPQPAVPVYNPMKILRAQRRKQHQLN